MTQESTTQNRRSSTRLAAKPSSRVLVRKGTLDIGPNLALKLLDVSERGIRLVLQVPVVQGQDVSIALESVAHGRPIKCRGRVVWVVETAEEEFCTGIRLDKPLEYRDLQLLGNLR